MEPLDDLMIFCLAFYSYHILFGLILKQITNCNFQKVKFYNLDVLERGALIDAFHFERWVLLLVTIKIKYTSVPREIFFFSG